MTYDILNESTYNCMIGLDEQFFSLVPGHLEIDEYTLHLLT